MADAVIAPFAMHGARDAMASGLAHIEEQVEGIEQAIVGNSGLAFDLAKTLIESTCRTVLRERSVRVGKILERAAGQQVPRLFRRHLRPFETESRQGAMYYVPDQRASIRTDPVIDPPQADFELDVLFAPYELANIVVPSSASLAADAGVKP